jgi:hypothetical protein
VKLVAAPQTALLTGSVKLDAAYAIATGLGRVVANHGAEAVQFAEAAIATGRQPDREQWRRRARGLGRGVDREQWRRVDLGTGPGLI